MTKASFVILVLSFVTLHSSSQSRFSNETKKFIEYQDSITVFKNALLIDGKGGASRPHQTVITTNGKINWIGDDTKATIPNTNRDFWENKISKNRSRDMVIRRKLRKLGWKIIIIWQCDLNTNLKRKEMLKNVLCQLK